MNTIVLRSGVLALLIAPLAFADERKLDIRKGIPADAYMAVYGQHNPEREYQREYQRQIWQTIKDERLSQRISDILINCLPTKEKETVASISEELQIIFEPVDWSTEVTEVAYGQVMEVPQTHHLVLLRLPSDDIATTVEKAIREFAEMVERRSEGAVDAAVDEGDTARIYSLTVPKIKEFPFQPAFARLGDVLVFSTSANTLRTSVGSLLSGGESKFDEPRIQAALSKLPQPEDALVIYDGLAQFAQMRGIGQFIREKAANDAQAVRFAGVFERAIDELAILDYEVTVEFTDGYRNLKTSMGQLLPDVEEKLLYQVCASGPPFEHWERWVPADAQAFSLFTGVNLHALHERGTQFIRDEFPEAQAALEKFEQAQQEWGVHVDRDILQAFSGECVSVTLPASLPTASGGQTKVIALRCDRPDRIRELLHQGVDWLAKNPLAQSQQVKLAPSKELEGFEELSANMLSIVGSRPIIGFKNGWMILASDSAAAQKVLRTLSGDAPSFDKTEQFKRFKLEIDGPVYAISYSDLSASARKAAQFIRQAGTMAPMAVATAAAAAKADAAKLKPVQDALALIPSIANVVEKFDYLQARLSVVQTGDEPGSYVKRSITLVRPPVEKQGDNNVGATLKAATTAD
jgi:hypothetical protein